MQALGSRAQQDVAQLHQTLAGSRLGRRWERLVRRHAAKLEALLAVHPQVREDVETALGLLAREPSLDAKAARVVQQALIDLYHHATVPLQRDIAQIRDEVQLAQGRTLEQLLEE